MDVIVGLRIGPFLVQIVALRLSFQEAAYLQSVFVPTDGVFEPGKSGSDEVQSSLQLSSCAGISRGVQSPGQTSEFIQVFGPL